MVNLSDYARNPKAYKISAIDFDLIDDNLLIIKPSSTKPEQVFFCLFKNKDSNQGKDVWKIAVKYSIFQFKFEEITFFNKLYIECIYCEKSSCRIFLC